MSVNNVSKKQLNMKKPNMIGTASFQLFHKPLQSKNMVDIIKGKQLGN